MSSTKEQTIEKKPRTIKITPTVARLRTGHSWNVSDEELDKMRYFEDALQYFSAKTVNADIIITRNLKDFAASEIPIMTAEDYLEAYE